MRDIADRFLTPDDFGLPEEVQLSAENDPPRIRRAGIVGICLLVAGVIALGGWLV